MWRPQKFDREHIFSLAYMNVFLKPIMYQASKEFQWIERIINIHIGVFDHHDIKLEINDKRTLLTFPCEWELW